MMLTKDQRDEMRRASQTAIGGGAELRAAGLAGAATLAEGLARNALVALDSLDEMERQRDEARRDRERERLAHESDLLTFQRERANDREWARKMEEQRDEAINKLVEAPVAVFRNVRVKEADGPGAQFTLLRECSPGVFDVDCYFAECGDAKVGETMRIEVYRESAAQPVQVDEVTCTRCHRTDRARVTGNVLDGDWCDLGPDFGIVCPTCIREAHRFLREARAAQKDPA